MALCCTGLEGLVGLRSRNGTLFLMGLCEGNHCEQNSESGTEKGNGVMVVLRKQDNRAEDVRPLLIRLPFGAKWAGNPHAAGSLSPVLLWLLTGHCCLCVGDGSVHQASKVRNTRRIRKRREPADVASINGVIVSRRGTRTAEFRDYSGIDYNAQTGMLAVVSQEEAKLWVSRGQGSGLWGWASQVVGSMEVPVWTRYAVRLTLGHIVCCCMPVCLCLVAAGQAGEPFRVLRPTDQLLGRWPGAGLPARR